MPGVALITAAGGAGIGRATARQFALAGWTTIATDRHARRVQDVAAELRESTGADVHGMALDVTDEAAVRDVFAAVQAEHGPVTRLVNNSGITALSSVEETTLEQWRSVVDVCLTGTFLCTRAVLPQMRGAGGGVIVNLASVAAWTPTGVGESAYAAAKAGVIGLTKATAAEYAKDHVRVVAVAPGLTMNPFLGHYFDQEWFDSWIARTPLGRAAEPDELAQVIFDVSTDRWSYVTGETVNVSGGVYLRP